MANDPVSVQLVHVTMSGARPGEPGRSQTWYAALPAEKALEAVKDTIPPGWGAELAARQLSPQDIARLGIKAGDVGELES
jgi:hypothetical protein